MTTQRITEYCLSKLGAVLEYPFGPDPAVFKVGNKIFATIYHKGETTRIGMKCDPMLADLLRGQYVSIMLMWTAGFGFLYWQKEKHFLNAYWN